MHPTRRALLGAAAALAAAPSQPAAAARWDDVVRYPDPAIETLDPSFARYRIFNAAVERLWTGARWGEGPVWFGDGRFVVWSDVPNDRLLRWDEVMGAVGEFRRPSGRANGNTRDRQGRLITCEQGTRRLTRTEPDGTVTVLADRFEGKPLNSPNDAVVKSDGTIWFTDPPFGILNRYTGLPAPQELPTNIYRLDPGSGRLTVVAGDVNRPNGLAFSPDERVLYVAESGSAPRGLRAYDVAEDGARLTNRRTLVECAANEEPDGFRVDTDGNLWCGWGTGEGRDGVRIFAPGGKPIGHIHLPERCANLCFGGAQRNRLFMAASSGLYALYVNAQGVAGG